MDFLDCVLNSIGKGGPNLLVPSGLFVFIRIQYSVLLWLWWISILFWALCMHEIMVVLRALLWWIHALLPSAKPLGFTSSLGSTFLRVSHFEKTPFVLGISSIPLKLWSESSIPFGGYVHKVFVIVPANFGGFWTCFDPRIIKSWSSREQNRVFCVVLNFSYHRLNWCLSLTSSVQPVCRNLDC